MIVWVARIGKGYPHFIVPKRTQQVLEKYFVYLLFQFTLLIAYFIDCLFI